MFAALRDVPGGGIGAIDLIQLLRFERDSAVASSSSTYDYKRERSLSSNVWRKSYFPKPDLQGVQKKLVDGYQSPVLTTMEQVEAVVSCKEFNSISHSFRLQHMETICRLLPASERATPPPLPAFLSSLSDVVRVGEGEAYQATASDWRAWGQFRTAFEKATGVHLNRGHRQQLGGGMLSIRHSCFFGGRPSWEEREERKAKVPTDFGRPKSAGTSHKCDCPAHITAFISLPYAYALGISQPAAGEASSSSSISSTVRLELNLSHQGHTPNSMGDLFRLPLDSR